MVGMSLNQRRKRQPSAWLFGALGVVLLLLVVAMYVGCATQENVQATSETTVAEEAVNPADLPAVEEPAESVAPSFATVATWEGHKEAQFAPLASGVFLENETYVVDFSVEEQVAFWVHYQLTLDECLGTVPRKDAFRGDPRLDIGLDEKSYAASGYDRGHLKPAADSRTTAEDMRSSFLMTNMAPQTPNLNRGIWKQLEEAVRTWGLTYEDLHVTCGPGRESTGVLPAGVRIPATFWKAVMRTSPDTACMAFSFPNAEKVPGDLGDFLVSVDELEQAIGLDLFPGLPDATEDRIEASKPLSVWPTDQAPSRPSPAAHSNTSEPSASVQCMGIAKSSGKRCQKTTSDPSGYCHLHRQ